jgi:hypothetical protein
MGDTTQEAVNVQASIHRRLSGTDRLGLAVNMSITARELSKTRLRRAHPEWSELQLNRELLRYAFAPTLLPVLRD